MNRLVLDVETTIKNKGNPHTQSNTLVRVGILVAEGAHTLDPYEDRSLIQNYLDNATVIMGFNLKFDLSWLRRYDYRFDHCRIFDCQLAEFILGGQSEPYPSLNKTAERYGLGTKLDIVKEQYWDKGIDTTEIPIDILDEYLVQDLVLTEKVYETQLPLLEQGGFQTLFSLQCQDLMVLADMEYNGMILDIDKSSELAEMEEQKIKDIEVELQKTIPDIPINWSSRDHLSAYLYGGVIKYEDRICVGEYKTGVKAGQPRYKILKYEYTLDKQVEPLKGSELKKEGFYATDDPTLQSLKANKEVRRRIDLLLQRAMSSNLGLS